MGSGESLEASLAHSGYDPILIIYFSVAMIVLRDSLCDKRSQSASFYKLRPRLETTIGFMSQKRKYLINRETA
jgi:hypothetical protein